MIINMMMLAMILMIVMMNGYEHGDDGHDHGDDDHNIMMMMQYSTIDIPSHHTIIYHQLYPNYLPSLSFDQ